MTYAVQTYPHMRRNAVPAAQASGIRAVSASASRVTTQTTDGRTSDISWVDLIASANQDDSDLADVYAGLYIEAAKMLHALPPAKQGLEIAVISRTGGATWVAEVYDAARRHRGDMMRADEGSDEPHKSLAISTARDIQARLAKRGADAPVVTRQ